MFNLKLPGYLQGISLDYYRNYIKNLIEFPDFRLVPAIMSIRNEERQDLLSGEWKSPEERRMEFYSDSIDSGQNYIRMKYHSGGDLNASH